MKWLLVKLGIRVTPSIWTPRPWCLPLGLGSDLLDRSEGPPLLRRRLEISHVLLIGLTGCSEVPSLVLTKDETNT